MRPEATDGPLEPTPDAAHGRSHRGRERLAQYEGFAARHADMVFGRVAGAVADVERALDVQSDTFLAAMYAAAAGGLPDDESAERDWLLATASVHVGRALPKTSLLVGEKANLVRELGFTVSSTLPADRGGRLPGAPEPRVVVRRFLPLLVLYFSTQCAELTRLAAQATDGFSADLARRVDAHAGTGEPSSTPRATGEVCPVCGPLAEELRRDFGPTVTAVAFADEARHRALEAVLEALGGEAGNDPEAGVHGAAQAGAAAPPAVPARVTTTRRRWLTIGLAALLCASVAAAFAVLGSGTSARDGAAATQRPGDAGVSAPSLPQRPADRTADEITAAMAQQRFATCRFDARSPGDPAWFVGSGRIDIGADGVVATATRVAYDFGEGHMFYPPDVLLIGDRAYVTPSPGIAGTGETGDPAGKPRTTVVEPASATYPSDFPVVNALEARAMAAPAHIRLLLNRAPDTLPTTNPAGHLVHSGTVPLRDLASDSAGERLYEPYARRPGAENLSVTFRLEVDARHLPVRLEVRVPVAGTDRTDPVDPFIVTFDKWGQGVPLTAP